VRTGIIAAIVRAGASRGPDAARNGDGQEKTVGRVAVVTDSASDLSPARAARAGITIVPLLVRFGERESRAGTEMSADAFWQAMLAPGSPFPTTAAASAGDFKVAYEGAFATGADAIVCVTVGGKLSATLKSAQIARDMLPDGEIHVVDSDSASLGVGILALLAAEMAAAGSDAATIAAEIRRRVPHVELFVALDTLEYLRRGGRISGAAAAVGTILSVKPIITVRDGEVVQAERVRTRSKARARVAELLTERPIDRVGLLDGPDADVAGLRADILRRLPGFDPDAVVIETMGPSIGPHIGPGFGGGVVLHAG
jgi:DegV family protein with EDD domain